MLVKKYSEFVGEGFVNKTLKRTRLGDERQEDKISTNIDQFKEVDLGFDFVFADRNLVINGEEEMTYKELLSYYDYLKTTGWRPITDIELKKSLLCQYHGDYNLNYEITYTKYPENSTVVFKRKGFDDTLEMDIDFYWELTKLDQIGVTVFGYGVGTTTSSIFRPKQQSIINETPLLAHHKHKVRLIKNK